MQDGRWWKDGSKIVFNCQTPIPARALQQAEFFLECARVYSCGAQRRSAASSWRAPPTPAIAPRSRAPALPPIPCPAERCKALPPPRRHPACRMRPAPPARRAPHRRHSKRRCRRNACSSCRTMCRRRKSMMVRGRCRVQFAEGGGWLWCPRQGRPAHAARGAARAGRRPLRHRVAPRRSPTAQWAPAIFRRRVRRARAAARAGISRRRKAAVMSNAIGIGLQLGTMMGSAMTLGVQAGAASAAVPAVAART